MRSGYTILSLAENIRSGLMWSHYGDSHRGFAVEYDLKFGPLSRMAFPVFYRAKLTNATRWIRRSYDFNNLFGFYTSLVKSKEWSYEFEWRIIIPSTLKGDEKKIRMPKPISVTLGLSAIPEDVEKMKELCARENIELRQMHQHHRRFELEPIIVGSGHP